MNPKMFFYGVIGVVAAGIIAALFLVGSPNRERLRRFDQVRITNLQMIQSALQSYWSREHMLPAALREIEASGFFVPADPVTKLPYGYEVTGTSTARLCATFSTADSEEDVIPAPLYDDGRSFGNWQHGSGLACFERLFDPAWWQEFPLTVVPMKR